MYLPFYIGFDSQAGGLTPNFMYPTARRAIVGNVGHSVHSAVCIFDLLVADQNAGTLACRDFYSARYFDHAYRGNVCDRFSCVEIKARACDADFGSTGTRRVDPFIAASMVRRLTYIGSLMTLLALLMPSLAFLLIRRPVIIIIRFIDGGAWDPAHLRP